LRVGASFVIVIPVPDAGTGLLRTGFETRGAPRTQRVPRRTSHSRVGASFVIDVPVPLAGTPLWRASVSADSGTGTTTNKVSPAFKRDVVSMRFFSIFAAFLFQPCEGLRDLRALCVSTLARTRAAPASGTGTAISNEGGEHLLNRSERSPPYFCTRVMTNGSSPFMKLTSTVVRWPSTINTVVVSLRPGIITIMGYSPAGILVRLKRS